MTDDLTRDLEQIADTIPAIPNDYALLREQIQSLPPPLAPSIASAAAGAVPPDASVSVASAAPGAVLSGLIGMAPGTVPGTVLMPGTVLSDAFSAATYIRNLINGPATVTIDGNGLTVENGALVLKDEFGTTVMVSSGFVGPWNDYVALGVYNPVFGAGVDTTLPEGRTANLPYWTVDKVTGTPTVSRRADTAYPSGHSVRVVFAAVNDKVHIDSDLVPIQGGVDYSIQAAAGWNKTVAGSTWVTSVYVRWYDGAGSYISQVGYGPLGPAVGATGTQAAALFSWTAAGSTAPLTARYASIRFSIEQTSAHDTGAHYWDIGMVRLGAAPTVLDLSGPHRTNSLTLENYLVVGDPGDTATFEVDLDGSFYIDDNGATIFRVTRSGLMLPGRGTSFPTDKTTGDHFWRTDLGMEFFWNGTRWLSTNLLSFSAPPFGTAAATDLSVSTNNVFRVTAPSILGGSDAWIERIHFGYNLNAGTGPDASNKWTVTFLGYPGGSTIGTIVIDSGVEGDWTWKDWTTGALLGSSVQSLLNVNFAKTGTPGSIAVEPPIIYYRVVAT